MCFIGLIIDKISHNYNLERLASVIDEFRRTTVSKTSIVRYYSIIKYGYNIYLMQSNPNTSSTPKCPLCKSCKVISRSDGSVSCKSCKKTFIKDYNINPSGSNNVYFNQGLPALMSDGRFITNYKPSREITDDILKKYNNDGTRDSRQFLQTNGRDILKDEYDIDWFGYSPKISCSQGWSNYIRNGKW